MATMVYLAMTSAEFAAASQLPPKTAWMACHFSPYSTGLSNLPASLRAGSVLILNDRIPACNHDPFRIARQLRETVEALCCSAVLLDFQGNSSELNHLADFLVSSLPCPVAVSEKYAHDLNCPVFLSPCPHHVHLKDHIAPWAGREIWLDLAADAETITLTEEGADILPLPLGELPEGGHRDEKLHCHYSIENTDSSSRFTLWRTKADLEELAEKAQGLGIRTLVGLWQEWQDRK